VNAHNPWKQKEIGLAVLLAALLFSADAAWGRGPVISEIRNITEEGLYQKTFCLTQDAEIEIEAVGSGQPDKDILFSYAWLLDMNSRKPVWVMKAEESEEIRGDNVQVETALKLPAGEYALYYSAFRGLHPYTKKMKILNIEVGVLDVSKMPMKWDEHGDPSRWQVVVRAKDKDFPEACVMSDIKPPKREAIIRFDKARTVELFKAGLEVREPMRVRIRATGEYVAKERSFADGGWIDDQNSCERVWSMDLGNTEPAGGAQKNRTFDGEVFLEPGNYLVCYVSDDSHSYRDWNSPPPYDPENWGIEILPLDPSQLDMVTVTEDPPDRNLIVRLGRMGDATFKRTGFKLTHDQEICVHSFGEYSDKYNRYIDYGWIEDARTLQKIWKMPHNDKGEYAGGEYRNRQVKDKIKLPAGEYYLCYVTDYAHAYGNWQHSPPYDPRAWGISVRAASHEFKPEYVESFEEFDGPNLLIRIGPMGDDMHKKSIFNVKEATTVRFISVGEGERGDMFDYAWLAKDNSDEIIWKMSYQETSPGGGAKKNRRLDRMVRLEPGRYNLHYKTDGSHSFEKWNDEMPSDPQFWGVIMLEVKED
jgi:hypothetical protein